MKKMFVLLLALLVLSVSLFGCAAQISKGEAEDIAIQRAGLTKDEVTFIRSELDSDDGRLLYDTEFYTEAGVEYDIDVDAKSGEVVKFEIGTHIDQVPDVQNQSVDPKNDLIGEERAKEIALERAELSADEVDYVQIVLDRDDGVYVYEVDFRKGRTEYEAEIKADDGKILSWDTDYDD